MPTTWTTVSPTGAWDSFTFEQFALATENYLFLRTESDLPLIDDYPTPSWTFPSSGSTTWTVQ